MRASLPARLGSDWFVGVALRGTDTNQVLARLDDAAAEAAASIAGRGARPAPKPAKRRAKRRVRARLAKSSK